MYINMECFFLCSTRLKAFGLLNLAISSPFSTFSDLERQNASLFILLNTEKSQSVRDFETWEMDIMLLMEGVERVKTELASSIVFVSKKALSHDFRTISVN